jgi:nucleotide-binding universal stress UspA family protein
MRGSFTQAAGNFDEAVILGCRGCQDWTMKIVVGYLATPGGIDALALGARIARTFGDTELEIVTVLPPRRLPALGGAPAHYDDLIQQHADNWLSEALGTVAGDVSARTHTVFSDSFAGGLITEVARLQADLLVVGGAGGGLAGRHSLGTVVNELLHSSPVPVAVAPRGLSESRVQRVREVTCALGERAGTDLLLDTAVRGSAAAGTPLRLVSLVALDPGLGSRDDQAEVHRLALAHARAMLEAAKRKLPEGFPVTAALADGDSVEDAVSKLTWHDGDLIMVGSSRLSVPRRLFLGSTAAKMLRVLDVPMVVVPREQLSEEDLP